MGETRLNHGRGTGTPSPIDRHVGERVRQRRGLLGITQTGLGQAVGVTFQQIQKYERGANRIGASRIFDLAYVLGVSVGYFFEEMPAAVASSSPARQRERAPAQVIFDTAPLSKRESLELIRAYYQIGDPRVRKRVHGLIKALGADSSDYK